MRRILILHFALVGLLANVGMTAFGLFWFTNKLEDVDAYQDVRRMLLGTFDGVEAVPVTPVASGQLNPALGNLPDGLWHKIHQQPASEAEAFGRQSHAGAAFDPVRGRVMLFGSDTHGQDWDNSVRFFDMAALSWSRAYPPDPPDTYRVNAQGIPVAGAGVERPWAMHTFDAVEFDPISDQLIVASHPAHLDPARFRGVDRNLWRQIKTHPTWGYQVQGNRWTPLALNGQSFFPYGATFDADGRELIGVSSGGYWAFAIDTAQWRKLGTGTPSAWHNTAAFDRDRSIVVTFGTNTRDNSVWQYRLGEDKGQKMPTVGDRPPGADSAPLVFHPGIKKVVALVETRASGDLGQTETWLYDTAGDRWEQLTGATIPFAIGMNYQMVHDPNHDLMVLVTNAQRDPVAVWVLRL